MIAWVNNKSEIFDAMINKFIKRDFSSKLGHLRHVGGAGSIERACKLWLTAVQLIKLTINIANPSALYLHDLFKFTTQRDKTWAQWQIDFEL